MLYLEEAIDVILAEEGQFLLGLDFITSTLGLTYKKMETIFTRCAAEYSRRRPVEITEDIVGSPYVQLPKNALAVKSIRYGVLPEYPRFFQDAFDPISWEWVDQGKKIIKVFPPNTPIKVTYDAGLTVTKNVKVTEQVFAVEGQSEVEEVLKNTYLPGTLKISNIFGEMAETGRTESTEDDETIVTAHLSGTLGTGTININTREMVLQLVNTTGGEINIEYYPKYKCIVELSSDMGDYIFYNLFAYNILKSIATLRAQATQAQLHNIDLTNDGLIERVAELSQMVRKDMKSSISFGGLADI